MSARVRFIRWLPVLCWMGIIFSGSTDALSAAHTSRFVEPCLRFLFPHISAEALDTVHLCIRKMGHVLEYGILSLLLWRAIPERSANAEAADWRRAGLALLIAACYGASDEFHQTFIPSRGASVHDVVIDTCGAAIALAIVALAGRRRTRRAANAASAPVA